MKNRIITMKMPLRNFRTCLFFGLLLVFVSTVYAQQDDVSQENATTYKSSSEKNKQEATDHLKAVQLAQDGDLVSAYDLIQKAYKEFPNEPKIIIDYIVILTWMEKYDEAAKLYNKHQDLNFPDYAVIEVIKSLREAGQYEHSVRLSESFLETHPEDIDVTYGLIYTWIQQKSYKKAENRLIQMREQYSGEVRMSSLQALVYASQKRWTEFFKTAEDIKANKSGKKDPAVVSNLNEAFYLTYEESILFARQEKYDKAIDFLDRLTSLGYRSQKVELDRIVIVIWKENFTEALTRYQKMPIKEALPPYFLKEVARAYKQNDAKTTISGKHWEYIAPYVDSIEEDDKRKKAQLDSIHLNMEEGKIDEALSMVDEVLQEDPTEKEALFLKAEIYDFQKQYWMAVQIYNQILTIYPSNEQAFNLKLRTLMDLGATSLVLEEGEKYPELVDQTILERAKTDVPMHQIRWEEPAAAIGKLDELEKEYLRFISEDEPNKDFVENYWRVKWDRFLALRQQEKMKEIIQEYESLVKKEKVIPPWVERSAADAYLYEQRPEEALVLFVRLAKDDPSFDLEMSVYYALVDLGRYKDAEVVLNSVDEKTPVKIIERGILQDNFKKADIAFNKAWLLMYQDKLKKAEQYIKKVKKISPFNTNLRTAEAHNHLYRGWKRRALEDFKVIRTIEDRLISSHIGYARTLNENMQKQEARDEVGKILVKKPRNKHAHRLKRALDVEQMTTVTLNAQYSTESVGEDEFTITLRGDQPIGFHHTLFAEITRREETQEEGNQIARKITLGDQWQIDNTWRLVGALTGDYEGEGHLGYLAGVRMQPNDYWTFEFSTEADTLDISSRSRQAGINADVYTLSSAYRASEMFDTVLGVSYKDFTDNNAYFNYFWRTNTMITAEAYWKTRLGTEFSYETFSKQDVVYFSPEEVYSFYLIPMVEHTWFRRYEKAWVDRFYVGLGQKWQKSFGATNAGYVRYEQDHQFSDTKSLLVGTSYDLNYYDSDDVNALKVYTTAQFKF